MKNKYLVFTVGIFLIGIVAAVQLPHAFEGQVNNQNGEGLDGVITAEMEGVVVASSGIINGIYDLVVESENGGTIDFYIQGQSGTIGNYVFTGFAVTELDFTVQVSNSSSGGTGSSDSSSSSSSSGSNIGIRNVNYFSETTLFIPTLRISQEDFAPTQTLVPKSTVKSSDNFPLWGLVISLFLSMILAITIVKISLRKKDYKNQEIR